MSAFTETALLKKLQELNSSQQSIQTLSLWLIHHRKHHSAIIKTWYRELLVAPEPKKLTFMYLANDVIQNSKKKGPEYGREFCATLLKVFAHLGETCKSEKLFGSLSRILKIWEERFVYDPKVIAEYRAKLNGQESGITSATVDKLPNGNVQQQTEHKDEEKRVEKPDKRKSDEVKLKTKRVRTSSNSDEKRKQRSNESSNGGDTGPSEPVTGASPRIPIGDPPEPEELIKALFKIENSASSDAVIRERIANLPPEISEISCLNKLEDKDAANKLAKQVNEAVQLLNDYNARLASEMDDRTKLATMLKDFHAEQRELLAQAEKRYEEYKVKLEKMKVVQKEIRDHLSNLPDLTSLPDVTGGLAPLPSAGDLFNIH